MLDEERIQQRLAEGRDTLDKLRASEAELRAQGIDVPALAQQLSGMLAELEKGLQEYSVAQESLLQSQADLADAEREYFRTLCSVLDPIARENPFDPRVRAWLEVRAAWLEHLPREDSEL